MYLTRSFPRRVSILGKFQSLWWLVALRSWMRRGAGYGCKAVLSATECDLKRKWRSGSASSRISWLCAFCVTLALLWLLTSLLTALRCATCEASGRETGRSLCPCLRSPRGSGSRCILTISVNERVFCVVFSVIVDVRPQELFWLVLIRLRHYFSKCFLPSRRPCYRYFQKRDAMSEFLCCCMNSRSVLI